MSFTRFSSIAFASAMVIGLTILPFKPTFAQEKAASPAIPLARPTVAKICSNCHTPEQGNLRGYFDSVAYKTQSIQIRIDDAVEILRFDKAAIKVQNVLADNTDEPLRSIKNGKEVRVQYIEKDGKKFATLVVAKPAIKVAPEKLLKTEEVEKLVAAGPENGKYLLIDCRPAPKFMEGAIPTAINIPFAAFDKNIDKLPKDKNALIVYYCAGAT
jgi:Rhodanese-like domain